MRKPRAPFQVGRGVYFMQVLRVFPLLGTIKFG
jgi:hypothetical protein